jgi:hydrogenase/urease accessory protein HupE
VSRPIWLAVLFGLALAAFVGSHAPFAEAEGFRAGLEHPFAVPTHVIALVACGLLAGQRDLHQHNALVAVFIVGLIAGLAALALGVGETPAGDVVVAAAALAGLLVAIARPMPVLLERVVVGTIGAAIGLDSPPEVVSLRTATAMLVGTGLGATILAIMVAEIAGALTRDWQRIGLRVLGSWIAASAMLVLAVRFGS